MLGNFELFWKKEEYDDGEYWDENSKSLMIIMWATNTILLLQGYWNMYFSKEEEEERSAKKISSKT